MFATTQDVRTALAEQRYIASDEISTIVLLAERLGKPLLAEGPAGVGKTELAKVWAAATGRDLIRLQCYEGLDESKALYEWEYAKQMLYTQLLRDKLSDVLSDTRTLTEAADRLAQEEDVFFSERFLLARPLLRAINSERPTVLLIDEIDRADAEFEAFLLEVLSEALKRRCLYVYIDYPTIEEELRIVRLKVPELDRRLARQAVEAVHALRKLDLRKKPSVSETLDWARALVALNAKNLDPELLQNTLTILLKYEADVARARRMFYDLGGNGHGRSHR
mgnify:CR=1 FL=1